MTIPYRVVIGYSLSISENTKVQRIIDETFSEIDAIYNKFNPQSEISKLNNAKAFTKIPLSKDLEAFFNKTDYLVQLTSGLFDPTVEPLQKLWREHLENGSIPSQEAILSASHFVGWDKIHIEEGLFWKEYDETALDFGGIAKGYAIDLITARLPFSNVYVEWGGEICTKGEHPEARPWQIGITKFGTKETFVTSVPLKNQAIASSGDYLQNWTVKGIEYTHIMNPRTKTPKTELRSATVIADTCLFADVLATTAMLFDSEDEAREFLLSIPGIQFWVFGETYNQFKKINHREHRDHKESL